MDELIPNAAFYFGQGLPIIMKDYEDNAKYICKDYPMGREDVDLFFHPKDAKTFNKDNIDKITCTDKSHCITSTPIDVESGQDVTGRPQTTPDNNEVRNEIKAVTFNKNKRLNLKRGRST